MRRLRSKSFGCFLRLCIALTGAFGAGCGAGSQAPIGQQTSDLPTNRAAVVTDTAAVAGQRLEIIDRGGACVLRAEGTAAGARQEFELAPKAPCHFLRISGSNVPRSIQYGDVKTEAVLIVSGTPASEKTRAMWKLEPGLVCGEESQGVLVRGGKVSVTKAVRKGGVACRDKGQDEKEYWAFAHDER